MRIFTSPQTDNHASTPPLSFYRPVYSGMLIVLHYHEHGTTITGTHYTDLIRKVWTALKEKRRGMLHCRVQFHQDNAPGQASSENWLPSKMLNLLQHPPYSPDLAPNDYYLFPKQKEFIKRSKFADNKDIINMVNGWMEEHDQQFFFNGIRVLGKCWTKCVSSAGDYAVVTKYGVHIVLSCVILQTF